MSNVCDCGSGLRYYALMGRGTTYCDSCVPRDGSPPRTVNAGPPPVQPAYGGAISTAQHDGDVAVRNTRYGIIGGTGGVN